MDTSHNFEKAHEGRFAWRTSRQIHNPRELAEIAQWGGADAIRALPKLPFPPVRDDPKEALRYSIQMLWFEAAGGVLR
jgi:hypothetical protein